MKNSTAFAAAGVISLFAWDAAFAQSPSQIPLGAGANVTRQPAGSRFRNPTNPPPAVVAPVPVAAPTAFSWTGVYVGGDFGGSFASTFIASATPGWASCPRARRLSNVALHSSRSIASNVMARTIRA